MRYPLLLDGSEIRSAEVDFTARTLQMVLSAAHVLCMPDAAPSHARPSATEGYLQAVRLTLQGVAWANAQEALVLSEWMGGVANGRITLNQAPCHDLILPVHLQGAVELSLSMRQHGECTLSASRLDIEAPSNARFVESMAC